MSTIALGTRAADTLQEFHRTAGTGAPVLVYASHGSSEGHGAGQPSVTWTGEFGGYQDAVGNGAVPRAFRAFRPRTMQSEDREAGHWYGYFTVAGLTRSAKATPLTELRQWSGDRMLSPAFVPHGPLIVVM